MPLHFLIIWLDELIKTVKVIARCPIKMVLIALRLWIIQLQIFSIWFIPFFLRKDYVDGFQVIEIGGLGGAFKTSFQI